MSDITSTDATRRQIISFAPYGAGLPPHAVVDRFRAKCADLNPASVAKGRHRPALQLTYSAICPGLGGSTPGLPEVRSSSAFPSIDRQ